MIKESPQVPPMRNGESWDHYSVGPLGCVGLTYRASLKTGVP